MYGIKGFDYVNYTSTKIKQTQILIINGIFIELNINNTDSKASASGAPPRAARGLAHTGPPQSAPQHCSSLLNTDIVDQLFINGPFLFY